MDILTIGTGGADPGLPPGGSAGGPGVPESRDVAEFDRIYGRETGAAAPEGVAGPGLGGSLLEGLETLGIARERKLEALQKALDRFSGGDMSVKDMLDVQMKLADLSLTETYALKLGEKGSEGIKTLFTNQ